jgi:hypothetical protein
MYTQFLEGEVGTKVSDKNIEPCLLLIAEELTSTKGSCSDDELRPDEGLTGRWTKYLPQKKQAHSGR